MLYPLRRAADSTQPPARYRSAVEYGVLVVVGLSTEAFAIAVLGGTAARVAPRALLGTAAPATVRARSGTVIAVAVVAGVVVAGTGFTFLLLPVPLQITRPRAGLPVHGADLAVRVRAGRPASRRSR